MKLFLFDATPAAPGEKHGPEGPTHCGTVTVDYEYQVDMWVADISDDYPHVVRCTCPGYDGHGKEWERVDGKLVEKK